MPLTSMVPFAVLPNPPLPAEEPAAATTATTDAVAVEVYHTYQTSAVLQLQGEGHYPIPSTYYSTPQVKPPPPPQLYNAVWWKLQYCAKLKGTQTTHHCTVNTTMFPAHRVW